MTSVVPARGLDVGSRAHLRLHALRTTHAVAGQHAQRAIGGGELIFRSSVGDRERVDTRVMSVLVDSVAANSLAQGSLVDVYVNRPTGTTGPGGRPVLAGPERRLERASVRLS